MDVSKVAFLSKLLDKIMKTDPNNSFLKRRPNGANSLEILRIFTTLETSKIRQVPQTLQLNWVLWRWVAGGQTTQPWRLVTLLVKHAPQKAKSDQRSLASRYSKLPGKGDIGPCHWPWRGAIRVIEILQPSNQAPGSDWRLGSVVRCGRDWLKNRRWRRSCKGKKSSSA